VRFIFRQEAEETIMFNVPSVRDLAARIEARAGETAALREAVASARDLIGGLQNEAAQLRAEQRALQQALEAEQAARLDAVAALHDLVQATASAHGDRLSALEGVEADTDTVRVIQDYTSPALVPQPVTQAEAEAPSLVSPAAGPTRFEGEPA
jgi:phage host-nuclease inhibitor protein Gam